MPGADADSRSDFAATFPARVSRALEEARGAFAGIAASRGGDQLLDSAAVRRLHEIYRLRVELEIETAAVLWRTAEVVCALTDAIQVLERRRQPVPFAGQWLGGLEGEEAERLRERISLIGERPARGQDRSARPEIRTEAA